MTQRIFFDCNASYGPRGHAPPHLRLDLPSLLDDLDQYGIAAALVRHQQAILHDPMAGNLRLIKEISPHRDRLHPCWVATPNIAGDMPSETEFGHLMRAHGVRAVQLSPGPDKYPVVPRVLGSMAEVLAANSALILAPWHAFNDPYRDIKALAEICQRNPIILTGMSWRDYRMVCAVLVACPNVNIEMSAFQANRVVETFTGRFGSHLLFFGSGHPDHSAGAARALMDWSLADAAVVDQVAGLNLCAALGIDASTLPAPPPPTEPIQQQARHGAALTELVIDAHCHVMGNDETSSTGIVMMQGDAAGQLEVSSRCGIDVTAMMSWQGPWGGDVWVGNALIKRLVQDHPASILGLSSVDPLQQTPEAMLDTIRPLHETSCFPGIKPYFPTNGVHYHDPVYDAIWEYANTHCLYTLLHTSETPEAVNGVVELARRFPDVSFIFAHTGGSWRYAELAAQAARQAPNIYCELTLTPVCNGIVEYLVAQAGQDRVLFGTDAPMRDPRPQLGWVVHSRLGTEAKRDVLGRNFLRILEKNRSPGMAAFAPLLQALRAKAQ